MPRAQGAAGRHGAMMALARRPLSVAMSGAFRSACARRRPCWGEAQTVAFRRMLGGRSARPSSTAMMARSRAPWWS